MWAILLTAVFVSADGTTSMNTLTLGSYDKPETCESVAKQLRKVQEGNWSKYTVLARCVQVKG